MADRVRDETDLIQTYLAPLASGVAGAFGLSDDAATISIPPGFDLVVSTDPVIANVHFFPDDRADDIAWKSLAVNASDLAAKGAQPLVYTMTLAFAEAPERNWMATFAQGLASAQRAFGFGLIGGDTDMSAGPLSVGVTAIGIVPAGRFVRRSGAKIGDRIFVSGTVGDSALGLSLHRAPGRFGAALTEGDASFLVGRYLRPNPRLALAEALREHARAALDVSDGLVKDAGKLASMHGAEIGFASLPLSPPARRALECDPTIAETLLSGGDDYEIIAAVDPAEATAFVSAATAAGVHVTDIGCVGGGDGCVVLDETGARMSLARRGYDHFSRSS